MATLELAKRHKPFTDEELRQIMSNERVQARPPKELNFESKQWSDNSYSGVMLKAVEAKQQQTTFMKIVKEYGMAPLLGLGAVAAISKELIWLNEEFLLFINFWLLATSIYLGIEPVRRQTFVEARIQRYKRLWGWDDFKLDRLEAAIREKQISMEAPEIYREYQQEYNEAVAALMNYMRVKPRHEARAAMLKRLQDIAAAEEEKAQAEKSRLKFESIQYVRERVAKDAAFRAQLLNEAIDALGGPMQLTDKDPVVKVLNSYLSSKGKGPIKL